MTLEDDMKAQLAAAKRFRSVTADFGNGFHAGLAHERKRQAERSAALERVAKAAHGLLESGYDGPFIGPITEPLFSALAALYRFDSQSYQPGCALDRAQADTAEDKYTLPKTQAELDLLTDGAASVIADGMRKEGFVTLADVRAEIARVAKRAADTFDKDQDDESAGLMLELAYAAESGGSDGE